MFKIKDNSKYRIRYHRCSFHFLSQTNKTTEMGIVTNAKTRKNVIFVSIQSRKRFIAQKKVAPRDNNNKLSNLHIQPDYFKARSR